MPTLLRIDGFRFFFFSNEGFEPVHVHVEKADAYAKFWLDPIELAFSRGLSSSDMKKAREIIVVHRDSFVEKWNEYFAS